MSPLLSSLVNCTMTWLLDNTMVPGCCDPQYFPFVDEKNRNRLFILVCFFWLNVKELESLTFLRKNRFFYLNYTYEIALASVIDCDSVIHAIFTVL